MRKLTFGLLGCAALLSFATASTGRSAARVRPALTVFAAASLTGAFNELADTLKERQPDLQINCNHAGSQVLALQIQHGAAADVFATADERWMARVRDSGFVDGQPRIFARNRLVVIVPASNPAGITNLQALGRPGVKLVLAAEAVPAGRYAREAIDKLAHQPGFAPDFAQQVLRNVVSNEDNVKAVVAKVQLGEADAGVVYVSDVTATVAQLVRRLELPDAANVVASYPIAALRRAPNPAAARAFMDLILSPVGQRVLVRHGFLPAEAAP
jgi:molybdate transport system substrate-binding protein